MCYTHIHAQKFLKVLEILYPYMQKRVHYTMRHAKRCECTGTHRDTHTLTIQHIIIEEKPYSRIRIHACRRQFGILWERGPNMKPSVSTATLFFSLSFSLVSEIISVLNCARAQTHFTVRTLTVACMDTNVQCICHLSSITKPSTKQFSFFAAAVFCLSILTILYFSRLSEVFFLFVRHLLCGASVCGWVCLCVCGIIFVWHCGGMKTNMPDTCSFSVLDLYDVLIRMVN